MRTRKADNPSLVGLDDDASSLSRCTNASTNASYTRAHTLDVPECRSAKRRKTAGLNTRFDRMIKSVNSMLSYRNSTPALSRRRMKSSGTSSVSSHDIPKTPVDAYSNLHPGKFGKDFSILKMKRTLPLPLDDSDEFPMPAAPPKEPRSPLPDWLANTFCSLEAGHPLRGLLSPSRVQSESKSGSLLPPVELPVAAREEELFAFSPFEFEKQEETADRANATSNVRAHVLSTIPTEPSSSLLQVEASISPLPFSTPGCFAPVRSSMERSIVDTAFQKPLVPVSQKVTSCTANMMHPPALPASHLRPSDVTSPQFTQAFSTLVQGKRPPSDLQQHDANINIQYQVSRGRRDNMNVYVTPGPTFAYSRPVYFDSPTEDPSLSDPLQPESYELDLNAIDFRWRPFLRSNDPVSDMNRRSVSPPSPIGYLAPDRVGDQSGWNARSTVDQGEGGTSNEEFHSFAEDVDIAYLDHRSATLPSDVHAMSATTTTTTTKLANIHVPIQTWSPPINDVQAAWPAAFAPLGIPLSPLRDQSDLALLAVGSPLPRGDVGKNIHTSEELRLLQAGMNTTGEPCEVRPLTPTTQVPVSPPSTPQKVRSSQMCEMPRAPVRKTFSALSWMAPSKSSKCATAVCDDVNRPFSRVSANSHDSIESWSES